MGKVIYEELKPLFYPKSVAVVGATETAGKYGFNVFFNLVSGGFKGEIYPVNRRVDRVLGFKAYKSVKDIPVDVDLTLIVVPASQVPSVMEDCVEKNVKACIVISAGFRETGDEGKKFEDEVISIARRGGIRVVGPNCMGIFNTSINLNVLMAAFPLDLSTFKGKISFVSQSGNLGTNMAVWGFMRGVGFNKFVSSGNEADLTCEDFIEYFGYDPETKVIIAYIEGFKPNSKFPKLAKEITRKKPIVILKTGATEAGAKAARSHVGAMATKDEIVDALFKQTGVIRVYDVEELFDTAVALANQPLPKGRRVGIVTGGGGWGVVCTDMCAKLGLHVTPLSRETIERIDKLLPSYWSKSNPVDTVAMIDPVAQFRCVEEVMRDENVDGVIYLGFGWAQNILERFKNSPYIGKLNLSIFDKLIDAECEVAKKLLSLIKETGKPVYIATLASNSPSINILESNGILVYPTPERAAKVFAKAASYKLYLDKLKNVKDKEKLGSEAN